MKKLILIVMGLGVGTILAYAQSPMELDLANLQPVLWDAYSRSAIAVSGHRWDTIDVVTTSGDTVRALLLVASRGSQ